MACVSIIGKDNSPIYIATQDLDKELELSYRVHAALDVIDEKCNQKQAAVDSRELFLGQLYSTELYRIYGYVTNTKVKCIIVIDNSSASAPRENEIRTMFRNLHLLLSEAICNPFYMPGDLLVSKSFDKRVRAIMNGGAV